MVHHGAEHHVVQAAGLLRQLRVRQLRRDDAVHVICRSRTVLGPDDDEDVAVRET